jgi:hypothetical protein
LPPTSGSPSLHPRLYAAACSAGSLSKATGELRDKVALAIITEEEDNTAKGLLSSRSWTVFSYAAQSNILDTIDAKMEIEYQDRLVVFIDVLGFKNLVYSSSTELINRYYTFLVSNFQAAITKRNFDFLLISDSIVVFCNNDIESLSELTKLIGKLQAGLLGKGILVRGAISHGALFVDKVNNIIVGKGLINAYQLEMQAKYPRVILDRSIVSKYYGSFSGFVSNNVKTGELPYVAFTPPGLYPIDYPYLNYGWMISNQGSNQPFEAALNLFKSHYYTNDQIEKFEWLRSHLVESLEELITLRSSLDPNRNRRVNLKRCRKYISKFTAL